jgi:hypothetical protein
MPPRCPQFPNSFFLFVDPFPGGGDHKVSIKGKKRKKKQQPIFFFLSTKQKTGKTNPTQRKFANSRKPIK